MTWWGYLRLRACIGCVGGGQPWLGRLFKDVSHHLPHFPSSEALRAFPHFSSFTSRLRFRTPQEESVRSGFFSARVAIRLHRPGRPNGKRPSGRAPGGRIDIDLRVL